MSYGAGQRRSSDPALLWLWCRLAATALIRPLAWEPLYAAGAALWKGRKKKQKQKKQTKKKPKLKLMSNLSLTVSSTVDTLPLSTSPFTVADGYTWRPISRPSLMGTEEEGYLPVLLLSYCLLIGLWNSSDFLKQEIMIKINEWPFTSGSSCQQVPCFAGGPSMRGWGLCITEA